MFVIFFSVKESDGKCVVLDGSMNCPPEDSNGCDGKGNDAFYRLVSRLPHQRNWKGLVYFIYTINYKIWI